MYEISDFLFLNRKKKCKTWLPQRREIFSDLTFLMLLWLQGLNRTLLLVLWFMPASFAAKGLCQTPGIVEKPWLWPCPLSGSCTLLLGNLRSEHKTTAATKDHQHSTERKKNLTANKAMLVCPQIFGCKSIECIFCIILLDLVTPTFFPLC